MQADRVVLFRMMQRAGRAMRSRLALVCLCGAGIALVHAATPPGADVFSASNDYYGARGAVLSLRHDAANGTGAPQLALAPDYPRSLPAWRAAQRRDPANTALFEPCANTLIAATDELRRVAPLMQNRGSNLAALNAGIRRANALVAEGDRCIANANKQGQTRLQGIVSERQPVPNANTGGGRQPWEPTGGDRLPPGGAGQPTGTTGGDRLPPGGRDPLQGRTTTVPGREPSDLPILQVAIPKGHRVPEGFKQPTFPNYACYDKDGFPYTVMENPSVEGDYFWVRDVPRIPPARIGYDECINPGSLPKGCPPRYGRGRYPVVTLKDECHPPPGDRKPRETPTPVFHVFYVNGINTPERDADAVAGQPQNNRGSYDWDRQLIATNLLGTIAPRNHPGLRAPGSATASRHQAAVVADTRVSADERVVFTYRTYNRSGANPYSVEACRNPTSLVMRGLCNDLAVVNRTRASGLGGMAGGDILECAIEALGTQTNLASTVDEVTPWVDRILEIFRDEATSSPPVRNYFILIGHSQGNFHVEGMAWQLRRERGAPATFIFNNRLAILSLASPTSYSSLRDGSAESSDFLRNRLRHFTRSDDGILALASLGPLLQSKVPFPPNLLPLWDYAPGALKDLMRLAAVAPDPGSGLGVTLSPALTAFGWSPNVNCIPEGNPLCNNALYTPLMNSHLIDNYLTDPPLTQPGRPVSRNIEPYLLMDQMKFNRKPVLKEVRGGMRELKQNLLKTGR